MPEARLYIGNLSSRTSERELRDEFEHYGKVTRCDIKKGFAFVHMEDSDDADEAIRKLNDEYIGGRRVLVEFCRSRGPRGPGGLHNSRSYRDKEYYRSGRGDSDRYRDFDRYDSHHKDRYDRDDHYDRSSRYDRYDDGRYHREYERSRRPRAGDGAKIRGEYRVEVSGLSSRTS